MIRRTSSVILWSALLCVACFSVESTSLASTDVSSSHATGSVIRSRNILLKNAFRIRGGAGPIDKVIASKVVSSLYMLQGITGSLAPQRSLEAHNIQNPSKLTKALHADMSGMVSAIAVATHASLFHACSAKTSLGLAGIPIFLTFSKWILNNEAPQFGMPAHNAYALCMVGALTVYSGLFQPGWAGTVLGFLSYFFMVNGVVGMVLPAVWGAAFGITDMAKIDLVMHRMLAAAIGGFGLLVRSFLDGKTASVALAFAVAPALVNLLALTFVWKEAVEVGMKIEWTIVWSILLGGYIATVLL